MHTVFKWEIPTMDDIVVPMPKDARILAVDVQNETPCLWALVDAAAPRQDRRFRLAGTGHPIDNPDELTHIGTFLMHGGRLVFHLFEVQ